MHAAKQFCHAHFSPILALLLVLALLAFNFGAAKSIGLLSTLRMGYRRKQCRFGAREVGGATFQYGAKEIISGYMEELLNLTEKVR